MRSLRLSLLVRRPKRLKTRFGSASKSSDCAPPIPPQDSGLLRLAESARDAEYGDPHAFRRFGPCRIPSRRESSAPKPSSILPKLTKTGVWRTGQNAPWTTRTRRASTLFFAKTKKALSTPPVSSRLNLGDPRALASRTATLSPVLAQGTLRPRPTAPQWEPGSSLAPSVLGTTTMKTPMGSDLTVRQGRLDNSQRRLE